MFGRFDGNFGDKMKQILLERSRTDARSEPTPIHIKPIEVEKFKQKSYGKVQMKRDFVKAKEMVKTKEEYAQMILEDEAIVEQFVHAQDFDDYANIVENILGKYEMLKILR